MTDTLTPFCIDKTETTVASYAAFLDSVESQPIAPPAGCEWRGKTRTQYTPSSFDSQLAASPQMPVVGVDWCQAYAYCERNGKRLCGAPGGGLLADPESKDSEWYLACSRDGTLNTPIGDFVPGLCVECVEPPDGGSCPSGPAPVGSSSECVGGYDGIVDMLGNVSEWIAYCDTNGSAEGHPEEDECRRRGGSFRSEYGNCISCAGGQPYPCLGIADRQSQSDETGIRCCASPR